MNEANPNDLEQLTMINAMTINRNWSTRPRDERYTDLYAMQSHMSELKTTSRAKAIKVRDMAVSAEDGRIVLRGPQGAPAEMTHWSFGQVCTNVGAAAAYLRKLPAELVAQCLSYGLKQMDQDTEASALLTIDRNTRAVSMRALNSTTYGRIWNADILDALIPYVGNGIDGTWRVPGEFGKRVAITKENTTLYGSDRDMVIMLADEDNRIELPARRDGKTGSLARGIIVGNSEVGSGTAFIAWFLFDYLCCNRIIWGLQDIRELSIRHTSGGPRRWIHSAMPQITAYAKASAVPVQQHLIAAQKLRVSDPDKLLTARFDFSKNQARLIDLAHRQDEGRPMETVWDVVTAVTAYARTIEHADARLDVERTAGRILQMAA